MSCAPKRTVRRFFLPYLAVVPADVDETTKKEIKDKFMAYDRTLLAADPRHREAKKFGGPGARAKYQKVSRSWSRMGRPVRELGATLCARISDLYGRNHSAPRCPSAAVVPLIGGPLAALADTERRL